MSATAEVHQPRLSWWGHVWRLVVMLALSALIWVPVVGGRGDRVALMVVVDVGLGIVAYVLVCWRRRSPVPVAVAVAVLSSVSGIAGGPAVLALASVATRRRWREIALVGVLNFASAEVFAVLRPAAPGDPFWLLLFANLVATAAIVGWGLYIGSRRELLWTLRQRAERAEAEQELRAAQARSTERARIAREMHDVLAHRISQVAMHAGALGYRDDLGAAELREGVQLIQQRAHEALGDLRGVLGVLRDTDTDSHDRAAHGARDAARRPQPTYDDLPALVDEARDAGQSVTLVDALAPSPSGSSARVPDQVGRTVYRIVQEGMTNARKHAPGATVRIDLAGSAEEGLRVRLENPLGFGSGTPGAGLGLVGLRERAELLGGRLEHRREHGAFVLDTWLPWSTARDGAPGEGPVRVT